MKLRKNNSGQILTIDINNELKVLNIKYLNIHRKHGRHSNIFK